MAWPDKVVNGNINSATLTRVKIDDKDNPRVLMRTDNPETVVVMIREGILSKIQ